MKKIETDVIITGAGPTGLALACQLARYGVDFVVIEKNEGVTRFSKAIGVQARTLEIYEQLGLAQPAIERGEIAGKVRLLAKGHVRGEMHLANFGASFSAYPYMLMLEQSKNEELLYEYLRRHSRDVFWGSELESFSQNGGGVTARIKTAGGESQVVTAKYLVGCDGAHSPVREGLGLTFEGGMFERLFYVADVVINWTLPHDAIQVCLARKVFVAFFPMKGKNRYRIVGTFPEGMNTVEGEVTYEAIEQQIKADAEISLEISDVKWFSLYKVHSRRVNKFSAGRCFVAGDAAHIHSPAGAQGMNTGIQDAYNLAWKLAFAIKGYAGEELLETYNEERLENARRLLDTTDRFFEFAAGTNWLMSLVRTTIFPRVAGAAANLDSFRRRMFPLISQVGISYRKASLSEHRGDERLKVKAGDRMPYFTIDGRGIYDKLREPKFHLLIFSRSEKDDRIKSEIESEYGHVIDRHFYPLDARVAEIFGTDDSFCVLLRPDNYIGLISADFSLRAVRSYLHEVVPQSLKGLAYAR